jgi:hypothetical protein
VVIETKDVIDIYNTRSHELLGRAFGVGSVELFVHHMKQVNFTDSFVPANAPKSTPGQFGEFSVLLM